MTVIDGDRLIIRENPPEKVAIKEPGPPGPNALSLLADVDFTTTPPSVGNVLAFLATGKWGPADVATDAEVTTAVQVETDRATTAENAITAALDAHENATTNVHGITDTSALVYTNDPRLVLPGDLVTTDTTQTITGAKTFQAANATAVGLIVQGAASQTADLLQLKNSAGTILTRVDPSGSIYTPNGGAIAAGGASAIGRLTAYATSATDIPVVVKGFAAQSVDLQQWRNAAGTVLSRAASDGGMYSGYFQNQAIGSYVLYNSGSPSNLLLPAQPSHTVLVVKGAAAQSANLQEWQTSTGSVRSWITAAGAIATTSTISSSGNGGAIPAGVQTYVSPGATGTVGLVVQAFTGGGQTADLQQWQDSTGAVQASVSGGGRLRTTSLIERVNGSGSYISFAQSSTAIVILSRAATDSPLIIQGVAGQTGSLQQWLDNSGTVLSYVRSDGSVVFGGSSQINQLGVGVPAYSGVRSSINTANDTVIGQVIRRNSATQSAELLQVQDETGGVLMAVTASGSLRMSATLGSGTWNVRTLADVNATGAYISFATDNSGVMVNTRTATNRGLVVKGSASQSANLQEWQNSAAAMIARVDSAGTVWGSQLRTLNARTTIFEENGGATIRLQKQTAQSTAPTAGYLNLYVRDGTTVGTQKLVVVGPGNVETTIVDNIA